MPTRKEILDELRNNIGELSSNVAEGSADVRASAHAAENIAKGLKKAGDDLVVAAVVGSLGAWVAEATSQEVRRINATTQMTESVLRLQARYERLSYEFIIERCYVEGASREQKQNRLNELILAGVVESEESELGERFYIDVKNPRLLWWQKKIESLKAGE